MRWFCWWRPPCLLRRVIVNLTHDPTEAFEGVLVRRAAPGGRSRTVSALKAGQAPEALIGDVLIERDRWPICRSCRDRPDASAQLQALTTPPPSWHDVQVRRRALDLYGALAHQRTARSTGRSRTSGSASTFSRATSRSSACRVFRRDLATPTACAWPITSSRSGSSIRTRATTRYRLIEDLVSDFGIYFNAYWLKVRIAAGRERLGLLRLPPEQMTSRAASARPAYVWTAPNGRQTARSTRQRDRATSTATTRQPAVGSRRSRRCAGSSPRKRPRRLSRVSSGATRRGIEGVIERPATAPKWTPTQKQAWREQWQEAYAARRLAPGLRRGPRRRDAVQADRLSARRTPNTSPRGKLRREECAAAYHIPQPMVGILDHATFSNIREQHKKLYQDSPRAVARDDPGRKSSGSCCPSATTRTDVYVEFNIAGEAGGHASKNRRSRSQLVDRPAVDDRRTKARAPAEPAAHRRPDADDGRGAAGRARRRRRDAGRAARAAFKPTPEARRRMPNAVAPRFSRMQARLHARLDKVPAAERSPSPSTPTRWTRELAADLTPLVGDGRRRRSPRATPSSP